MASSREIARKAREAVRVQREMLVKQRADAEKATKVLEEQKAKLPPISQRNLRVGTLAGLSGLKRRTIYSGIRKDIEQRQSNIGLLMRELEKYESEELNPYEKEIDAYERAVEKANRTYYIYSAPKTTAKVSTQSTSSSSGYSSVAKPSSTTFTVSTPSKITLPSSILNSSNASNVTKKKSLFSWRK